MIQPYSLPTSPRRRRISRGGEMNLRQRRRRCRTPSPCWTTRRLSRSGTPTASSIATMPPSAGEALVTFKPSQKSKSWRRPLNFPPRVTFAGDAEPRRDMEQLSGGQTTLVAIAFILAIQSCVPLTTRITRRRTSAGCTG